MHLYRIAARSYIGSSEMEAFVFACLISVDLPLSLLSSLPPHPCSMRRSSRARRPRSTTPPKSTPCVALTGEGERRRCPLLPFFLSLSLPSRFVSLSLFPLGRLFRGSELTRVHVRARRATLHSLSYYYFFVRPHKLPFSVDFPCRVPLLPLMSESSDPSPWNHSGPPLPGHLFAIRDFSG